MARGINKVILIGNLGADPEMRYTQGGLAIARLRLATSDSVKDRASGEFRDVTEWHRVACFDRLAEVCGEFLRKGSKVYIEGRLSTSKYEKDGQTHYSTEIIAREMQMLDGRSQGGSGEEGGGGFEPRQASSGGRGGAGGVPGGGGSGYSGGSAGGRRREEAPAATAPAEDFDDDIPF